MNKIFNDICLVKLDEDKYYFHSFLLGNDLYVLINDKITLKTLVSGLRATMILEVFEDEFLVSWSLGENKFNFQHLYFDRDKHEVITKYEREYTSLDKKGEVRFKDNLVIFEEDDNVIIYDYRNSKNLTLNNFVIFNGLSFENDCLIGRMNIDNNECLVLKINSENLDIDMLYSVTEEKFIPVLKNEALELDTCLFETLTTKVYPYLEYKSNNREAICDDKVYGICKKLIKNNK